MDKLSGIELLSGKDTESKEYIEGQPQDDDAEDIADVVNRQSFSARRHPNDKSPRLERSTFTSILLGGRFKTKQPTNDKALAQILPDSNSPPIQQTHQLNSSPTGSRGPETPTPDASSRVEKGRSLGRTDPYEVPESPRRSVVEERAVNKPRLKRRGPRPKPKEGPNKGITEKVSVDPTQVSDAAEELVGPKGIEHSLTKQAKSPKLKRNSRSLVADNSTKNLNLTTRVSKAQVSGVVKASRKPVKTCQEVNPTKAVEEARMEPWEQVGFTEKDLDMESQEGEKGVEEVEVEEELVAESVAMGRNGYSSQNEGISTILMHPTPSPINVTRPVTAQISHGQSHVPDFEREGRESIDVAGGLPQASRQSTALSEPRYSFIDRDALGQMLLFMSRVGRNKSGKKVINVVVLTVPGRKMMNSVNALLKGYGDILKLMADGNTNVERIEHEVRRAVLLLEKFEEMTYEVLTSRLGDDKDEGDNANDRRRRSMVGDLYFHVIPGVVDVLDTVSKLNRNHSKEIIKLVGVLCRLSEAAVKEENQPERPRNKFYYLDQPTRKLLRVVSKLYDELMGKARVEEAQRTAPERVKKRKEQRELIAREEEEQFRQRQIEINTANWASLSEVRARLGLPPCSPEIRASESSQGPIETLGERGRSNLHPASRKRAWSKFEMETLVDGLRQEYGEDRYERIATKLDRRIDEVVERARYFKTQMEFLHEKRQQENPGVQFAPIEEFIRTI